MKHCFFRNIVNNNLHPFASGSSTIPELGAVQDFGLLRDATQRGWKIFPVMTGSRFAMGVSAMLGQATNDLDQLDAWARQYPGCNWAVTTGRNSNVLAIEMDGYVGTSSFSWLLFENQEDQIYNSPTLISQTEDGASNAVCAFYRWPAALAMRPLRREFAPGIRLRGEGDTVLIPPSIQRTGLRYLYLDSDAEVAVIPQWLIDLAFVVPKVDAISAPEKFPPRRADQESSGVIENPFAG